MRLARRPTFSRGTFRGTWATGMFPRLHVQMTALGARENAEGAAVLDAYAFQYGGQSVENMQRTPH